MPNAVVVIAKRPGCPTCVALDKIMNKIESSLRSVSPSIRIVIVNCLNKDGEFDYDKYPNSLYLFTAEWAPQILLIPGGLWDEAMSQLGPSNSIRLRKGVQVMNADWVKEQSLEYPKYHKYLNKPVKYSLLVPEAYAEWLKEALAADDFIKECSKYDKPIKLPVNVLSEIIGEPKDSKKHKDTKEKHKEHKEHKEHKDKDDKTSKKHKHRKDVCAIKIMSRK